MVQIRREGPCREVQSRMITWLMEMRSRYMKDGKRGSEVDPIEYLPGLFKSI